MDLVVALAEVQVVVLLGVALAEVQEVDQVVVLGVAMFNPVMVEPKTAKAKMVMVKIGEVLLAVVLM